MDTLRDRYVVPPVFFFAMLALGAWLGNRCDVQAIIPRFQALSPAHIAALSAMVVAILFPIGFTIQSVLLSLLRIRFFRRGWGGYSAFYDKATWERIVPAIRPDVKIDVSKYPAAAALAFSFEKWNPGIIEATTRLWTAFNVSLASIIAISAALVLGHYSFGIRFTWWWIALSFVLVVLFAIGAWCIWKERVHVFEFQALRLDCEGNMPAGSREGSAGG